MNNRYTTAIVLTLMLVRCATAQDSMITGAAAGGTIGALAGSQIGKQKGDATIGAVTGAMTGAGFGALFGYLGWKEDEQKRSALRSRRRSVYSPALTAPDVQMIWVEDEIQGNRYVEGHKVWIIDRPAGWTKSDSSPQGNDNRGREHNGTRKK